MSCNNYMQGFSKCKKSVGGIKRVWVTSKDNIAIAMDYDDISIYDGGYLGKLSTLILKPNYCFELLTEISDSVTLTTTITSDESVGYETYTNEVQVKIPDLYGNMLEHLNYMNYNNSGEFVFLFEDMQCRLFVIGLDNPMKMKQGNLESGTVIGDFNGGTITFGNEGVISMLMTKDEAQNGEWSSRYPKLSELTNTSKLKKLYNPLKNATDDDVEYGDIFIHIYNNDNLIKIDFEDIQESISSENFSFLDTSLGDYSDVVVAVDNTSDYMNLVCNQLKKKGIDWTQTKKSEIVVMDCRDNGKFEGTFAFGSYDNDTTYVVMPSVPKSSFVIVECDVTTKNNTFYPTSGMKIELVINNLYYMPENWK